MPMKIGAIKAETKPFVCTFETGTIEGRYYPNVFSANAVDEMQEAGKNPETASKAQYEMARSIIQSWDLEKDDGSPVGLSDSEDDEAYLRANVPISVFGAIFIAIQEAQNPKGTGRNSSAG